MRILIVSALYSPYVQGGAEKVAQMLAEGLAGRGHEVCVVTTQPHGGQVFDTVSGLRVDYLPVQNLYRPFDGTRRPAIGKALWHAIDSWNPAMAEQVGEILDDWRPDLLHTHAIAGFSPSIWRAAERRNILVVHTLHDYYLLCPRSSLFKDGTNCEPRCLSCRAYGLPRTWAARYVSGVAAVSRHMLDTHLAAGLFSGGVEKRVIYNPYIGSIRQPATAERGGPLRIGFLGRLHPTKGLTELIEAFLDLPRDSAVLCIAGRGEADYERELKLKTRDAAVEWMGFVSPSAFFEQVDVLVMPSLWHDPAPLVTQEAMAHGIPLIAARRGGIPELAGEAGWFYEPDEPGALGTLLLKAIQARLELHELSEKAGERARSFTAAAALDAYEALYDSLRGAST